MVEAQKATREPDEMTKHELKLYDGMRLEGFDLIQIDMDEAQEDPSLEDDERSNKIDELFAEVDTINAAVDAAKADLLDLSESRSLGRLARMTSEIRDKEMAEQATCPGPEEVKTYSEMGRIVTYVCQSKLRQMRVKKAKV